MDGYLINLGWFVAVGEIRITLETLYDILRNEKKKEDLQKLDDSFFADVIHYLKEKEGLLEKKSEPDELFAAGERQKLEYELRSIRRILKEIYEKREKKIIDIAMNRSRTGSDIIDTSAMLKEEKEFYIEILKILDFFRKGVLLNLFKGNMPNISVEKASIGAKKEQIKLELQTNTLAKFEELSPKEALVSTMGMEKLEQHEMKKVRFIHPLPSFVWKDMKVYGPYDKGEEAEMFPEVAELLVRKGRALII